MFEKWHDATYRFFSIASVTCVKLFSANSHNGSRDIYCTWYEHFHTSTQLRSSRHNFLFLHVKSTYLVDDSHASRVTTFHHSVASNRQFQRFVRPKPIPFIHVLSLHTIPSTYMWYCSYYLHRIVFRHVGTVLLHIRNGSS